LRQQQGQGLYLYAHISTGEKMTKEALKLALEALEGVLDDAPKVLDASIAGGLYEVVQCRDAITAIKEALAQPEQEPVAWRAWVSKFPQGTGSDWVYVTKPIMKDSVTTNHSTPPPQRTWVGLTEDEAN
jgi:hypothetical protein